MVIGGQSPILDTLDAALGAASLSACLRLFRSQFSRLVDEGRLRLIAQGALTEDPPYPGLPNILDQAKTPDDRQALEFLYLPLALGRSLAAPPGRPVDRLDVLRDAVSRTMRDADFQADAKRLQIDIEPMDAQQTAAMVNRLFATPAAVVHRIEAALAQ